MINMEVGNVSEMRVGVGWGGARLERGREEIEGGCDLQRNYSDYI